VGLWASVFWRWILAATKVVVELEAEVVAIKDFGSKDKVDLI
jgi:hypothetical protein